MIHNPKNNPHGNFRTIPNGLPGVETRTALLWSEGVLKGKISPQRFVELNSTNAAKLCMSSIPPYLNRQFPRSYIIVSYVFVIFFCIFLLLFLSYILFSTSASVSY